MACEPGHGAGRSTVAPASAGDRAALAWAATSGLPGFPDRRLKPNAVKLSSVRPRPKQTTGCDGGLPVAPASAGDRAIPAGQNGADGPARPDRRLKPAPRSSAQRCQADSMRQPPVLSLSLTALRYAPTRALPWTRGHAHRLAGRAIADRGSLPLSTSEPARNVAGV